MAIIKRGMTLLNASGDIDISSTGYRYAIDTMTWIRSNVIKQIFFELSIADYIDVDVGEAAWKSQIVQNLEYYEGGGFADGFINQGNSRRAQANAALAQKSMPTKTWAKKVTWTIAEIEEAANVGNWDVVEAKLKSLKKNWDLGIQEGAFNGFSGELPGLLNQTEVNINTTLITESISGMDATEFQTFVAALLAAYYANSNQTRLPDTFVMPTDDYLGMAAAASPTYPNISKLEYLGNALKKITSNDAFAIKPLTYAQAALNPEAKDRYILYRKDPEVMKLSIPVDITMNQAYTLNGFDFEQLAYGQISGVLVTRPREVLYIDKTTGT